MTEQLYYSDPYLKEFDAEVISSTFLSEGKYAVVLDRTAFYPEGGGQPGDRGYIGDIAVTDTQFQDGEIIHLCEADIPDGIHVHCVLDWDRRFDLMQQHSGEHIISGIICSTLNCDNIGFHLGEDTVTIDYSRYADAETVRRIEEEANRYISEGHRSVIFMPNDQELKNLTYRSKKNLDSDVRIVSFPGADTCACCGTHLDTSSQVLMIKVISQKRFHDGIRLEILCGNRAVRHMLECWEQNSAIGKALSVPHDRTYEAVTRLLEQCNALKEKAAQLEEENFGLIADSFTDKGNTYIIRKEIDPVSLRRLCDSVFRKCNGFCVVFSGSGTSFRYALMADAEVFPSLLKSVNTGLNGRGGGRDGLAQGSVIADSTAIETFMKQII